MKEVTLKTGETMPQLGLGTWMLEGDTCTRAVEIALDFGYTHIDTAVAYGNHEQIAPALASADIAREELFITSKVWRENLAYEEVLVSGEQILSELGIDYLDLLLIHWPNSEIPMESTFQGLAELSEQGLVKSIGVSNFTINHLKEAVEVSPVPVTVNQVEFHPYLYQKELLDFCQDNDIVLTAYSPLARGDIFQDDTILELAENVGRSPAQLVLRWLVEQDIVVIPKASSRDHIEDNFDIFGWEFDESVHTELAALDQSQRYVDPSFGEFDR